MNRLTIIPIDKAIYVDNDWMDGFDLSIVPEDIHALQWQGGSGWIERKGQADELLKELPDWANKCLELWNKRKN